MTRHMTLIWDASRAGNAKFHRHGETVRETRRGPILLYSFGMRTIYHLGSLPGATPVPRMKEYIEKVAVNTAMRLHSPGVVIRFAQQLSSLQYQSTRLTNVSL